MRGEDEAVVDGIPVVETALQSFTIVAGAGPAWIGLHPGRVGKSMTEIR